MKKDNPGGVFAGFRLAGLVPARAMDPATAEKIPRIPAGTGF